MDQKSDDPLSSSIFMIMSGPSDDCQKAFSVCAWSAHTGLSYIGTSDSTIS